MFMNYEKDEQSEDSQRIRKDMEIMQDIIKDMNDIAKKRAQQRWEFVMFDIEEKDELDEYFFCYLFLAKKFREIKKSKFSKLKSSAGKAQMYRIVAFSVISIVFTTLLILK